MLSLFIDNENISFHTDLKVSEIEYPYIYLESILYNLISNAIKYRRPDIQSEVKISTYSESGRVVLEVADNGMGIDLRRYGHQVFKLHKIFHKGHESKGLGLFIMKNQIETLGGSVSVESEPNKGSIFKVVF
jgi:signal transduction histidine kinase